MEKQFINKRIKKNFMNKDFSEWNKDTIDYLVMLISINKFNTYHNVLFILLNDYIFWYKNDKINLSKDVVNNPESKENKEKELPSKLYTLEELINIKNELYLILYKDNLSSESLLTVDDNLYKNREYINDFGDDDIIIDNYFTIENVFYFIFLILGLFILKNLFTLLNNNNYNNHLNNINETIYSGKSFIDNRERNLNNCLNSSIFSGENVIEKISKIDLLNNPIINYFLNKLF
jgi:hypothetical protein